MAFVHVIGDDGHLFFFEHGERERTSLLPAWMMQAGVTARCFKPTMMKSSPLVALKSGFLLHLTWRLFLICSDAGSQRNVSIQPERFNWFGRVCSIFLRKGFVVRRLQIHKGYARTSLLALRKNLLRWQRHLPIHFPPN